MDHLYEIVSKYKSTRGIIIGGDINEELSVMTPGRRGQYFLDFVKKNDFEIKATKATYIIPAGSVISILDYFIVDKRLSSSICLVARLENIVTMCPIISRFNVNLTLS